MNGAVASGAIAVAAGLSPRPRRYTGRGAERSGHAEPRARSGCCCASASGPCSCSSLAIGAARGRGPVLDEHLFYLYALLPVAMAFIAEQFRVASAQTMLDQRGLEMRARGGATPRSPSSSGSSRRSLRREMGVMTISAL